MEILLTVELHSGESDADRLLTVRDPRVREKSQRSSMRELLQKECFQ